MNRFCLSRLVVTCGIVAALEAAGVPMAASIFAEDLPLHVVRGHSIYDLNPPRGLLNQVTINAWQDETGTHGHMTWATNDPTFAVGWVWMIDVTELYVMGNTAWVFGFVEFDNKFPELEGTPVFFEVIDNGNGSIDPPDTLNGYELIGGDFTVK